MNQFKINVPEGMEIDLDKSDLSTGEVFFKKKEIKLPTTNEECVQFISGKGCYFMNSSGNIKAIINQDVLNDPNTMLSRNMAEAFLALMQLVKFRDIWNEGWIADWSIANYKYVILFKSNTKAHDYLASTKLILNFKSEEVRNKFSEQFDDLIQLAKPLL